MNCTCKTWKTGIKEINGLISFCNVHGLEYHCVPFVFCPWCGKKLTEKPVKEAPVVFSVGQSVRYKNDYQHQLWQQGHVVIANDPATDDTVLVSFGEGESAEEVACNKKDLRPMS